MRKFKPLSEKTEDVEGLELGDVLAHSMSYLDVAAQMAQKERDPELLISIFKQSLKVSSLILAASLELEEEEGIVKSGDAEFGFQLIEGGSNDTEEDDE